MKIIAGLMPCDCGSVTKTRNMVVSYLPQSDIVLQDCTVYDEIEKGFSRYSENLSRQHEIEELLSSSSENHKNLLEELDALQTALLDSPYYTREATIFSIAKGLGFKDSDMNRRCGEFSGGYQMRIALAKVLAENPDLMMLDEPTNYLDIEARQWLKTYLKGYKGSLFLVCHDKGFMDETVNEVYELFNSHLSRYSGNYSFYEKQRKLELEQLEAAWKKQQSEIEKTEQFIERFRYKATKSKQVQSRIKQLDKLEPVVVPSHLKTLNFSFPQPPHSPNDMVVVENLTKCYGSQVVFKDFSMIVTKGQRLAVTGHNGIGKSTLLRIIAQQDSAYTGVARLGSGVVTGYYSQDTQDSLDMDGTVLSQVAGFGSEGEMRNALGSFLFSGDDIYKKMTVLSGGERSRLALLRILLNPASLLILDEPTNHLDINSKDMLLKALKEYQGTIIFVSHDAYFIRALADRILYLSEGEPEFFNGDYDYFEWKLNQRTGASQDATQGTKMQESPKSQKQKDEEFVKSFDFSAQKKDAVLDRAEANRRRNRRQKLKSELESLMNKVDDLEMKISEVKALMNLHENYSNADKINALVAQLSELENQKNGFELLWMDKSSEYETEFGSEDNPL